MNTGLYKESIIGGNGYFLAEYIPSYFLIRTLNGLHIFHSKTIFSLHFKSLEFHRHGTSHNLTRDLLSKLFLGWQLGVAWLRSLNIAYWVTFWGKQLMLTSLLGVVEILLPNFRFYVMLHAKNNTQNTGCHYLLMQPWRSQCGVL